MSVPTSNKMASNYITGNGFAIDAATSVDDDIREEITHQIQQYIKDSIVNPDSPMDMSGEIDITEVMEDSTNSAIANMDDADHLSVIAEHLYEIMQIDGVLEAVQEYAQEDILSRLEEPDTVDNLNRGYDPFADCDFDPDDFNWPKPQATAIFESLTFPHLEQQDRIIIGVESVDVFENVYWHDSDNTGPFIVVFELQPVYIDDDLMGWTATMSSPFRKEVLGYIPERYNFAIDFRRMAVVMIEQYFTLSDEVKNGPWKDANLEWSKWAGEQDPANW